MITIDENVLAEELALIDMKEFGFKKWFSNDGLSKLGAKAHKAISAVYKENIIKVHSMLNQREADFLVMELSCEADTGFETFKSKHK